MNQFLIVQMNGIFNKTINLFFDLMIYPFRIEKIKCNLISNIKIYITFLPILKHLSTMNTRELKFVIHVAY